MVIDAREIISDSIIHADICIVGTGPAGITLARELINQPFKICLLESGSKTFSEETQSLYEGEIDSKHGYPDDELTAGRCRQLGGSANFWEIQVNDDDVAQGILNVRYVIPDEIDFQQRDEIPYSGWPFQRSELTPYYEKAQEVCQIGPFNYETEHWETSATPSIEFFDERLKTQIFQFGPLTAFTQQHLAILEQANNVDIYTNANVVELLTNDDGSLIEQVKVATSGHQTFRVAAKIVILATGGMENARLLLMSNGVTQAGIGNQHDLVGRFFMDHPGMLFGLLKPADRTLFNRTGLYDLHRVDGTAIMGRFAFPEKMLREHDLVNLSLALIPRIEGVETQSVVYLRKFSQLLRRGKLSRESLGYLRKSLAHLDEIASYARFRALKQQQPVYSTSRGGWSSLPNNDKRFFAFTVGAQVEQTPDPSNRISLSREKDSLGCPRTKLTWTWSEADRDRIHRSQELFREIVAKSGLGEFQPQFELDMGGRPYIVSTHHHIGTTRMHNDPRQGVVDANCQVHGVGNLFMAGSSVFPTGLGYANPTLTVVALAARLADHIKQTLTRSDTSPSVTSLDAAKVYAQPKAS